MGIKNFDNDNDGEGYKAFDSGDNAVVKISNIVCELGSYEGSEYYQLKFILDAVNELDEEDRGRIPSWNSSKITVTDSDTHTSDLAKVLMEAEVLDQVLDDLNDEGLFEFPVKTDPEDEDEEPKVIYEDFSEFKEELLDPEASVNFEAETDKENRILGKAVAKRLQGKVFRASTDLNKSGEYSKVEKFTKMMPEKEDLFDDFEVKLHFDHTLEDEEDDEEDSSEAEDDTEDVIFGEDDEEPSEDKGEEFTSGDEEESDDEEKEVAEAKAA